MPDTPPGSAATRPCRCPNRAGGRCENSATGKDRLCDFCRTNAGCEQLRRTIAQGVHR